MNLWKYIKLLKCSSFRKAKKQTEEKQQLLYIPEMKMIAFIKEGEDAEEKRRRYIQLRDKYLCI